ncbi:MAG: hypothetical protein ACE5OW_05785 [Candidatus Bathyarchaeia archaeon]
MKSQKIVGALAALILISTFTGIVYVTPMDAFKEVPEQAELSTLSEAPSKTARFLWGERLLDIISQALIVFSAVICALTLFRGKKVD